MPGPTPERTCKKQPVVATVPLVVTVAKNQKGDQQKVETTTIATAAVACSSGGNVATAVAAAIAMSYGIGSWKSQA